jgi:TIR domain
MQTLAAIHKNIFILMTVSEKVTAIQEIAKTLDREEWSLIDLTLSQFKLQITEDFNGSKFDYVIKSLQNGSDDKVYELATHLKINLEPTKSDLSPTFWEADYLRLFISHLATDKITANALKSSLHDYAISGFVAHSDIEPTKQWQDEIELALRTCDCLVALMIKDFHKSNWTDQEIGVVLGRDCLIIPVKMGQDPYGFIGKFQAMTFKDVDALAKNIFDSVVKNKKTNKQMAYAIMRQFELSRSFAWAKENIDLVEKIEYWDDNLISRLKNAADNNSQIKHSFGVTSRIEYILSKIKT